MLMFRFGHRELHTLLLLLSQAHISYVQKKLYLQIGQYGVLTEYNNKDEKSHFFSKHRQPEKKKLGRNQASDTFMNVWASFVYIFRTPQDHNDHRFSSLSKSSSIDFFRTISRLLQDYQFHIIFSHSSWSFQCSWSSWFLNPKKKSFNHVLK